VKILPEHEAKKLLQKYGIPTTKFFIIEKRDDIEKIQINYPVVLKVSSPNILHKTDAGAIVLDIKSKEELTEKYEEMRQRFPSEIFIVEEMQERGVEIIAGIVDDDAFGKCIMVGIGGIFTEIYRDVAFRMVPASKEDIEDMLKELKGRKIFEGYRLNLDKEALIEILLRLNKMAQEMQIKQLDMNPIFLYEDGAKVIDAKIIMEE